MATDKRVFTLRLQEDIFDVIEYIAQKEHRSVTNFIEYALLQYLEQYQEENGEIILPNKAD